MDIFKTLKIESLRHRKSARKGKMAKLLREQYAEFFIMRSDLSETVTRLSEEQRAELRETRARAGAVLAKPSLSPEALRARAQRAAQWEKDHGNVSAFAGIRR
jgi:hypothetical protein